MQPKRVVLNFGTYNLTNTETADFISSYKELITEIKNSYPSIDIIINSVAPIHASTRDAENKKVKILEYNNALVELASKEGVKFLNSHEVLADENGYIKDQYALADGITLTKKAYESMFAYIRTRSFITKDDRPKLEPIPTRAEVEPTLIKADPKIEYGPVDIKPIDPPDSSSTSSSSSSSTSSSSEKEKGDIKVTFIVKDKKMGTLVGKEVQYINAGETATTVEAKALDGYVFDSWGCTEGRIDNVNANKITFKVPTYSKNPITVVAYFKKDTSKDPKVTVSPNPLIVTMGKIGYLKATVTNATGSATKVTWWSDNTKIAKVDNWGQVTGVSKGWANIIASIKVGAKTYYSEKVIVQVNEAGKPSITLNPTSMILKINDSKQIKSTVQNATGTITWSSSNVAVASVSNSGSVTAKAAGTATITATVQGVKATCKVTVSKPKPTISISNGDFTLEEGKSSLVSTSTSNIEGNTVTWVSSNSKVATVDQSGKVDAVSQGSATITVSVTVDGKKYTDYITVTVTPAPEPDPTIELSPNNVTLNVGETYDVIATVTNQGSNIVTWSSSDDTIVSVSGGKITANKAGITTITATVKEGVSDTCTVTVNAPDVAGILYEIASTTDLFPISSDNANNIEGLVRPTVLIYDAKGDTITDGSVVITFKDNNETPNPTRETPNTVTVTATQGSITKTLTLKYYIISM